MWGSNDRRSQQTQTDSTYFEFSSEMIELNDSRYILPQDSLDALLSFTSSGLSFRYGTEKQGHLVYVFLPTTEWTQVSCVDGTVEYRYQQTVRIRQEANGELQIWNKNL